jgi:hypothetical protein
MIKDNSIAAGVSKLMLEFSDGLDQSVAAVREACSDEEFVAYRSAISRILAEVLLEVLNPLYKEHPNLKPGALN